MFANVYKMFVPQWMNNISKMYKGVIQNLLLAEKYNSTYATNCIPFFSTINKLPECILLCPKQKSHAFRIIQLHMHLEFSLIPHTIIN